LVQECFAYVGLKSKYGKKKLVVHLFKKAHLEVVEELPKQNDRYELGMKNIEDGKLAVRKTKKGKLKPTEDNNLRKL
jgi:hypothetical protein